MPATPDQYLAALRAARARGLAIDARQARQIEEALKAWADDLARMLGNLPPDREIAVRRSVSVIRDAARKLERKIDTAVADGMEVTIEETLAVWHEASLKVARSEGIPAATMGAVARPETTTAAAFLSADSTKTWRSLVHTSVDRAATDVQRIVSGALLDGTSPDTLARALRPYVQGSDKSPEPIRDVIEEQPAKTRSAAYSTRYNATRIAFSETHNARREAEVAHFTADPLVECGQWTLSPNRGTQTTPDACDALAGLDWYGLGRGVFPLTRVPLSPHPFDRCEFLPLVRKVALAADAKPDPELQLDPLDVELPGQWLMTPAAVERARLVLLQVLNTSVSDN